jgi:hypothetical protein
MAANIEFTQGEDVVVHVTVKDSLAQVIDISADTFVMKIKSVDNLAATLASFTCGLFTDGTDGVMEGVLASADSLNVPSTVQYSAKGAISATPSQVLIYDVFRLVGGTAKQRIAFGLVTVNPAVSYDGV